jgi:hypothetical protein
MLGGQSWLGQSLWYSLIANVQLGRGYPLPPIGVSSFGVGAEP